MRISIPQPNYPPRAQVGETVYYRSPVNRYAVKRSVVAEIREGHGKYEQVMKNGDIVLKDPRMIYDFTTFPTREIAVSHVMATLIENINSRQTTINSLINEQRIEQRILATMQKFNPHITEPKRYCFMSDIDHSSIKQQWKIL